MSQFKHELCSALVLISIFVGCSSIFGAQIEPQLYTTTNNQIMTTTTGITTTPIKQQQQPMTTITISSSPETTSATTLAVPTTVLSSVKSAILQENIQQTQQLKSQPVAPVQSQMTTVQTMTTTTTTPITSVAPTTIQTQPAATTTTNRPPTVFITPASISSKSPQTIQTTTATTSVTTTSSANLSPDTQPASLLTSSSKEAATTTTIEARNAVPTTATTITTTDTTTQQPPVVVVMSTQPPSLTAQLLNSVTKETIQQVNSNIENQSNLPNMKSIVDFKTFVEQTVESSSKTENNFGKNDKTNNKFEPSTQTSVESPNKLQITSIEPPILAKFDMVKNSEKIESDNLNTQLQSVDMTIKQIESDLLSDTKQDSQIAPARDNRAIHFPTRIEFPGSDSIVADQQQQHQIQPTSLPINPVSSTSTAAPVVTTPVIATSTLTTTTKSSTPTTVTKSPAPTSVMTTTTITPMTMKSMPLTSTTTTTTTTTSAPPTTTTTFAPQQKPTTINNINLQQQFDPSIGGVDSMSPEIVDPTKEDLCIIDEETAYRIGQRFTVDPCKRQCVCQYAKYSTSQAALLMATVQSAPVVATHNLRSNASTEIVCESPDCKPISNERLIPTAECRWPRIVPSMDMCGCADIVCLPPELGIVGQGDNQGGTFIDTLPPSPSSPSFIQQHNATPACQFEGRPLPMGTEVYNRCDSKCRCTTDLKIECSLIECPPLPPPTDSCYEWVNDISRVLTQPDCCPHPICKRPRNANNNQQFTNNNYNSSCNLAGMVFQHGQQLPTEVVGSMNSISGSNLCDKVCFCIDGEAKCQDNCPRIEDSPPVSLPCQPNLAIRDESECCPHWRCLTNDDLILQDVSVVALNSTAVRIRFTLPELAVGLRGYAELHYTNQSGNTLGNNGWLLQKFGRPERIFDVSMIEYCLSRLMANQEYWFKIRVYIEDSPIFTHPIDSAIIPVQMPALAFPRNQAQVSVPVPVPHNQQSQSSINKNVNKNNIIDNATSNIVASTQTQTPTPTIIKDFSLSATPIDSQTASITWRQLTNDELNFIDGFVVSYKNIDDNQQQQQLSFDQNQSIKGTEKFTQPLHKSANQTIIYGLAPNSRYIFTLLPSILNADVNSIKFETNQPQSVMILMPENQLELIIQKQMLVHQKERSNLISRIDELERDYAKIKDKFQQTLTSTVAASTESPTTTTPTPTTTTQQRIDELDLNLDKENINFANHRIQINLTEPLQILNPELQSLIQVIKINYIEIDNNHITYKPIDSNSNSKLDQGKSEQLTHFESAKQWFMNLSLSLYHHQQQQQHHDDQQQLITGNENENNNNVGYKYIEPNLNLTKQLSLPILVNLDQLSYDREYKIWFEIFLRDGRRLKSTSVIVSSPPRLSSSSLPIPMKSVWFEPNPALTKGLFYFSTIVTLCFLITMFLLLRKSGRQVAPITAPSQSAYDNPTFTKLVSWRPDDAVPKDYMADSIERQKELNQQINDKFNLQHLPTLKSPSNKSSSATSTKSSTTSTTTTTSTTNCLNHSPGSTDSHSAICKTKSAIALTSHSTINNTNNNCPYATGWEFQHIERNESGPI